MCNGSSSRISQGGTIAVLHPRTPNGYLNNIDGSLFFQNDERGTRASFAASPGADMYALAGCDVVIHQTGDLSSEVSADQSLHRFTFAPSGEFVAAIDRAAEMQLNQTFKLSVGDDLGIIGRRISVYNRNAPHQSIAEGVIGWN